MDNKKERKGRMSFLRILIKKLNYFKYTKIMLCILKVTFRKKNYVAVLINIKYIYQ